MSLKSFIKGWSGELQGTLAHQVFLDSNVYVDINNITLPAANGTTQIDHVIVSRFGIFVVETKNMSGWIFGDERARNGCRCWQARNTSFKTRSTKTTSM